MLLVLPPIKISLNDLGSFINLSDLSESDRLDFSKQIDLIASFRMNDGKSEIIVIKRPDITSRKLSPLFGHTVLLYKNGIFKKVADFVLPSIHVAYAFNQNSHTLVLYNTANGNVTRCLLDESGQIQSHTILFPHDCSKRPNGVKSLALTTVQDLMVLIDSNSTVYEIDISRGEIATISLLIKDKNKSDDNPNFAADNGDLYQTVQTIGEKNPVFFFQAKSCIDIIDQNYCQIYSIRLERSSLFYYMQVFTDFIDTYCVLFNGNINQVYCIQNLVSDTRIERQDSNTNLDKSIKPYIGNQLLDIIKRGEIQFGVPDLSTKTQYHFILSSEYSQFSDRIQKYYDDLNLKAQLKINYEENDLIYSSMDIDQLIKTVVSRVPLQLCTIEMGTLVPLNNGQRDKMDHLSSKSFRIEMKAREILFSFLDHILNDINDNIKIVGVIGRQSTGKSYLMNRIFRTRFAVAAGRCTDGIWMSYAFLDNTHFIILDCEGLFSDQRTEGEEIKLISFLSAVCDITILSQDLGFSRFQDRLFSVLSQAVDKIGINDKLFKGILLVAVRDISDGNDHDSFEAAEKKFLDLQKKGKSDFLEQIFSNTFKVQLLHHFENKNFDHEIEKLRQVFIKHVMVDETTEVELPCRWENGKDLADRLKILLVQLYTDDFIDSNYIHADMKLAELEEEMKRAWTRFYLNDEEHAESKQQQLEKVFEGKPYSLKFHHVNLELDENSSDSNFEKIYEFILTQLRLVPGFSSSTKEEDNKIYSFVNDLIFEIMSYRRQYVIKLMLERFQKKFPNENDNVKERKTKFINTMEQYMLSFKLQICLKKCSSCDLKCINNAQHTDETKSLLERKKDELTQVQVSLKNTTSKNIEERIKNLNDDIFNATENENKLHKEMILLCNELKYLSEKEKLETGIAKCNNELTTETANIDTFTQRINEIHQQLKSLLSLENDIEYIDLLLHKLDEDMQQQINPNRYKTDHLNELIEQFHQKCEIRYIDENELLCFIVKQEQIDKAESTDNAQLNTSLLSKMMTDNINSISNYRKLIQQQLEKIKEQLDAEQQYLKNNEVPMKEMEQQIIDAEKRKDDITNRIETKKTEGEKLNKQLLEVTAEQETLSKELNDKTRLIDNKTSPEMQKIQHYQRDLQDKLNIYANLSLNTDDIESRINQENAKLQFFLKEKLDKKSKLTIHKNEINSLNDDIRTKELQEQVNKDEQTIAVLSEKIDNIQKNLKSIEEELLILHDRQKQNEQLNAELNELNQLVEIIHSYDEQIESTRAGLVTKVTTKILKEEYIEKLKKANSDDAVTEEKSLKELDETIENIQTTLNRIIQNKTSACNNNTLLTKILNDTRYDIYQQQENKRHHLVELSKREKHLNEHIEELKNSLVLDESALKDQDQKILKIKQTFHSKKIDHKTHIENVQHNIELNEIGTKLFQSLSEVESSLITASEKLDQIFKAKTLIQEHILSSNSLNSAAHKQSELDARKNYLIQQLETKKNNDLTCRYTSTQECKEKYDTITKDYNSAHSQTEKLEQELRNMDVYSRLKDDIRTLEKEAQKNCSCGTDHKCSGICRICSEIDETKKNKCMFLAGHTGDHKCDAGHVCTRFCQICEIYGIANNRCVFAYEHKEPEHHRCERTHQCPATCVCSDPCAIPLGLQKHEEHRCNKKGCWKYCIFSCGNRCACDDHNHDAIAETVSMAIDNDIHQMKKHLCNQSHYCKGICNAPGVCKQEYKTQQKKWTTESGIEFLYDHIEVEEVREKCIMKIKEGLTSHDDLKYHHCNAQHTCPERCPDCGSFCRNLIGHEGNHRTLHRNKDQHIFTSTNPTEQIEIRLGEQEEGHVRIYKVGESAKPENCSVSCKRRGRSHFHLIECPGGSTCWEKVLGNKAKHSDETYYYEPDKPSTRKYDQILCSAYWSLDKWHSPVNDTDQKLIDSCNTYCEKHIERDRNGNIVKESVKGFCTLDAWHTGDHVFECQNDHESLEMYQGVDVCFVIDTTRSMARYLERVKQTITCIIKDNQELMKKLGKSASDFRFAIVDYRDHPPEGEYVFHTCDFTTDTLASAYVENLRTGTGGDFPEAVLDGLDAACELKWRDKADRLLFHILDAPPHGLMYHLRQGDKWPGGCPCGKTAQGVLQTMKNKNIAYHVLRCSNFLNMMITDFKKYIDVKMLSFDDKITFEEVIAQQVHQQLIDTEMTLKKA